jgi:drug/metabolite transporter (DMT)-like permease
MSRANPPPGAYWALVSALLFGASTPATKPILDGASAPLVAGLLYLGSGVGLTLLSLLRPGQPAPQVKPADWKWLAASIICGGILAPLLFVFALSKQYASSASLLLNLEGLFAALLALLFFGEHWHKRSAAGMVFIVMAGFLMAWSSNLQSVPLISFIAILGACFFWALDSNCTRNVTSGDPLKVAAIKGLIAGPVNLGLAAITGSALPALGTVVLGTVIGFLGYGVSLYCYIVSLHMLGTARTAGYFATAPFIGALLSVLLLGEPATFPLVGSGLLCAIGVWLHLSEQHQHQHHHEETVHDHLHIHDQHHLHEHAAQDPAGEPHSHAHHHDAMTHTHPHYPDLHHRHEHRDDPD